MKKQVLAKAGCSSSSQPWLYLRELVVCLGSDDDHPVDSLDWILPVANTLHTFELRFPSDDKGDIDVPDLETISRCTMLVKLHVNGSFIAILSKHVELVVASCTRLRVLTIFYVDADGEDVMRLRSSSLQQVELCGVVGLSVALETPALNELTISTGALNICSHALKKLKIDLNDSNHPTESRIRISPPLANLEFLSFAGSELCLREMREVLAIVQGGCVDVLQVNTYHIYLVNLASFLQPLTRLRSLTIPLHFMLALAKSRMRNEAQTLTQLGVEELIVSVATIANDYRHVDELMLVLREFLSSESLRKLVIRSRVFSGSGENGCRAALEAGVESLRDEFPGVIQYVVVH